MSQYLLLLLAAILYAGYNLFIKVSGDHVSITAETTIMATIALQIAALMTSVVFACYLASSGVGLTGLPSRAYLWAILAGVCIGAAEICYLYLFGLGGAGGEKLPSNVVIPFVVGATVVITVLVSAFIFRETFGVARILGASLAIVGIILLFVDDAMLIRLLKT